MLEKSQNVKTQWLGLNSRKIHPPLPPSPHPPKAYLQGGGWEIFLASYARHFYKFAKNINHFCIMPEYLEANIVNLRLPFKYYRNIETYLVTEEFGF